MHPRAILLAGVVICAGIVMPAHAADPKPVEVAHNGDVKLLAGDQSKNLCISLSPEHFDTTCADAGDSLAALTELDGARYVGAAVPSAAAIIEVRRAGVLLGSGPTVAGEAYKGASAGSVRFALVRLAKTAHIDGLRVRALNAAGALVEAVATDDAEELIVRRTRLLSGRSRGVTWRVVAEQRSELTPSLFDPAHETASLCVVTSVNDLDMGSDCESGLPQGNPASVDAAKAAGAETCNSPFRLLHGVVDGSVTAVSVLLGNGRRRTVPTVPAGDGRRTYAVATGANAVRSVTMPGRGVVRPGLAPMSAVCAGGGQGLTLLNLGSSALGIFALFLNLPAVTPIGPVTTIAGSPGMQVADGPADALCIAVAGRPFDGFGCSIVSPRFSDQLGTFDDLTKPRAFAVVVPARVATVRFGTADGKVVRSVSTDPGAGYRGPYAGFVRFASASIAGPSELARFELLDAAGTVLYRDNSDVEGDEFFLPRIGPARRVAGREGRPSLWQTNARYDENIDRCLSLTGGPPPPLDENCQTSRDDVTVLLDASCITKRLSVGIAVRAGTRVVADTGGKLLRPVRLHRGLAVFTLPSGRALRTLTLVRKGRRRHIEIGAPPGAKQCGWHLAPLVGDP